MSSSLPKSTNPSKPTKSRIAPWIKGLTRLGYASKAIVYISLGLLAVQAAMNWGGDTTGSKGVLATLAEQPLGQVLLFALGIGLTGYVLWRSVQAFHDPEHDQHGWQGWIRRLGYGGSAIGYGSLTFSAFHFSFNQSASEGQGSNSPPESAVSMLMQQPFGQWWVGTIGVCIVAIAAYYFYRAIRAKFRCRLQLDRFSPSTRVLLVRLCQFGIIARGVIFAIIGWFVIQAAMFFDPERVRSTGGVLQSLEYTVAGRWVLVAVALGLIAYGFYMAIQARYRRVELFD